MATQKLIDELAIKTLKVNGVAAVNRANSGHPGIVLGAAPIIHTLFSRHLKFDASDPTWINRDRFVLSAGHGSALLYAQLRLMGLVSEQELKKFRQLGSLTPGHPEHGLTLGVEATTGPLGQGIAVGVGLAIAEAHLAARFKEINHHTYVLCGDGDLQEGVAMEALSLAGHQKLGRLIVIHDSNDVQLDTHVQDVFSENLAQRMTAIGFQYLRVETNQVDQIDQALQKAQASDRPSFIEVKTIIGHGAKLAGTPRVHGAPLGDDFQSVKESLDWNLGEFDVPQLVAKFYRDKVLKRGQKARAKFKVSPRLAQFLKTAVPRQINVPIEPNLATRASSGRVIGFLNETLPNWIGGSADLTSSTQARGGDGDFKPSHRQGRNILFGVREFAMAAIANGLALHSVLRPFVSTFFVFSDYFKPALRLAALMQLPVVYVLTHDSVQVGEDGPTHQPVEQLAMLRATPNVNVFRPADEKEVRGAYQAALAGQTRPSVIVLTRQKITSLPATSQAKVKNGAYLVKAGQKPWTLVASGSELALAYQISQTLNLNCVSLVNAANAKVSWNTDQAISIEAASTYGMQKWARYNLGIDRFGASGPGQKVYDRLGFSLKKLTDRVAKIIQSHDAKK